MGNQVAPETPEAARERSFRQQKETKQKRELAVAHQRVIYGQRKMVEDFIVHIYACSSRVESMWLILGNKLGQRAFENFVQSEKADEFYRLFFLSTVLVADEKCDDNVLGGNIAELVKEYFSDARNSYNISVPKELTAEMTAIATMSTFSSDFRSQAIRVLMKIQREMIDIMARDQFSRFLLSKQYGQWRSSARSLAVAATVDLVKQENKKWNDSVKLRATAASNTSSSKRITKASQSVVNATDLTYSAFANFDEHRVGEVLGVDNWLGITVAAMEVLPICFSLCMVNGNGSGFPILYVNKYFEKITGYQHKNIIGKTFNEFIIHADANPQANEALSAGLRDISICGAIIKNKKANGDTFQNLVVLKPIVNDHNDYVLVVGLHMDVTKETDGGESKKQLLLKLAEELPDTLTKVDAVDEEISRNEFRTIEETSRAIQKSTKQHNTSCILS